MTRLRHRWSRGIVRFYVVGVVVYLLLGVLLAVPAYATENTLNPLVPVPAGTTKVPTGSDDASVQAYYDYLNLEHAGTLKETYHFNWQNFIVTYAVIAAALISVYFFAFAWYAKRRSGDLYPVEVFNGVVTERAGPIDAFNYAVWGILGIYMLWYIVIQLIYGQIY
jgi:ABC-type multidrug transport system permease subunit